MIVTLPYPHKVLWPNGRGHHFAVAREKKKAKALAFWEAKAAGLPVVQDGLIPVHITVHPKRFGPLPDRDNCSAANKAYQDGIAAAIGIDDKHFAEPTVAFADTRTGQFVVEIGRA